MQKRPGIPGFFEYRGRCIWPDGATELVNVAKFCSGTLAKDLIFLPEFMSKIPRQKVCSESQKDPFWDGPGWRGSLEYFHANERGFSRWLLLGHSPFKLAFGQRHEWEGRAPIPDWVWRQGGTGLRPIPVVPTQIFLALSCHSTQR